MKNGTNKNISKILTTHATVIEMYDDSIVYNEWKEGDAYLTYYKISTSEKRTIGKFESETKACVYGDYIIYKSSQRKITIYDISRSETSIHSNKEIELLHYPSIYNGKIVWSDQRKDSSYDNNFENAIYSYDIKNDVEEELYFSPTHKINPGIYENYIIWEEVVNDTSSIYLLEVNREQPIKIGEGVDPKIWGDYVVFGNSSLLLYSINDQELKEMPKGSSYGFRSYDIHKDNVVWVNGDFNELLTYDIKKNKATQILKVDGEDRFIEYPEIWDNKIIFYSNMDYDLSIYLYDPDSSIFGLEPMTFYYSIIILILIFSVILVYLIQIKRSKKNDGLPNYESDEKIEFNQVQDENKFQKFQCPNCKGTIEIKMIESPTIINCPHCGVKGKMGE